MNWLIERIKWWLCRKELERLHRYETHLQQYRQWFGQFDEISIVLVPGSALLMVMLPRKSNPTPKDGPWCIYSLRHAVVMIPQESPPDLCAR